jgi:glutamate N-acetyltransferase/amino-acid N-acetyltransferase
MAAPPLSPLARPLPLLSPVAGVRFATAAAGIRYRGRTDVLLAEFAPGTRVAGVFTKNRCPGAPVTWCREILAQGTARALLVNAGNANVFNGAAGARAVRQTADGVAAVLDVPAAQVYLASTGVIGEPLDAGKIVDVLAGLHAALTPDAIGQSPHAIMTTDTFPKAATRTAILGGRTVTITGIAKGSGMVAPDMATMLAFIFTDAALPAARLQPALSKAVEASFNRITIDSDTSTSDTVLLFATGAAGNAGDADMADFARALDEVAFALAQLVVRDGEGATKLVKITCRGAVSDASAHRVALSIANSPLVKTAIAGEDANWGRIVMAVGKAGEPAERDLLSVAIGGHVIAAAGGLVEGYDETPVVAHMKGQEIDIAVDLGLGVGADTVYTCDLTHGYIDINGAYRS